jgi:hypothetical protein
MTPPRTLARLTLGLLLLGLLWRGVRFALGFPIWGDEAMLGMNIARFDHAQLAQHLENCQIAPLLFLWGERSVWSWLGSGELAVRLLPFLAGSLALVLFWRWTRRLLDPFACLCAVGYLAVAIWPVSMSTLLKPYSFDLLMPMLLLVPATCWLLAPDRPGWLMLLTALTPLTMLGSYPAAFVAGAVALALVGPAWRQGWQARGWFAAYVLAMLGSFALALHVGNNQLHSTTNGVDTAAGMDWYWNDSFPPSSPWDVPLWLLVQTSGQMTAYPVGGSNGASLATVAMCVLGCALLVRRRSWAKLTLCVAPILLNLLAAFLHRYPYGASGRLSQHLAPGICLLAGLGLSDLVRRLDVSFRSPGRGAVRVAAIFALVGVIGLARDVRFPYRDPGCAWMRDTMTAVRQHVGPADPVVICTPIQRIESVFAWYWLNEGPRVGWDYELPSGTASAATLWAFSQGDPESAREQMMERLRHLDPSWELAERFPYLSEDGTENGQHFELFRFARPSLARDSTASASRTTRMER